MAKIVVSEALHHGRSNRDSALRAKGIHGSAPRVMYRYGGSRAWATSPPRAQDGARSPRPRRARGFWSCASFRKVRDPLERFVAGALAAPSCESRDGRGLPVHG